jgi:hypothetical protein
MIAGLRVNDVVIPRYPDLFSTTNGYDMAHCSKEQLVPRNIQPDLG